MHPRSRGGPYSGRLHRTSAVDLRAAVSRLFRGGRRAEHRLGLQPQYLLKRGRRRAQGTTTPARSPKNHRAAGGSAGAEKLGLTGVGRRLGHACALQALPGPAGRQVQRPVPLGRCHPEFYRRKYLSEDDLYTQALEREPDASAERRMGCGPRRNRATRLTSRSWTPRSACRSRSRSCTPRSKAKEVAARNAGDEGDRRAWGEFRRAVGTRSGPGRTGLAYLQDKAGATPGSDTLAAQPAGGRRHDWVVGSFFQHDSRDRPAAAHHNTIPESGSRGPDGTWRTLDSRSIYRWRPAAGIVAERTCERLAHARDAGATARTGSRAQESSASQRRWG
ncbi:hypothetical protein HBB16_00025 [Pseudonocardia sp. MCCB 268]|nr:hypothetical protein [Pseudonocardia cytotoxica]